LDYEHCSARFSDLRSLCLVAVCVSQRTAALAAKYRADASIAQPLSLRGFAVPVRAGPMLKKSPAEAGLIVSRAEILRTLRRHAKFALLHRRLDRWIADAGAAGRIRRRAACRLTLVGSQAIAESAGTRSLGGGWGIAVVKPIAAS
jgi:hypothetical protein